MIYLTKKVVGRGQDTEQLGEREKIDRQKFFKFERFEENGCPHMVGA